MLLKKNKMKTYEFSAYGRAKMELDIQKEKTDKINNITSILLTLVLFGIGVISKEFLVIYFIGKGMNYVVDWFV